MGIARTDSEAGVVDYSEPGKVEGRLVGFAVGKSDLHLLHRLWLDAHVVPVLDAGGSVVLTGLTSRSGSYARNLTVSTERANSVFKYLRAKVQGPVRYSMDQSFSSAAAGVGETPAALAGQRDGTEDAFYRAVLVAAWHKPVPPRPPEPKPKPAQPSVKRVVKRYWNKFNSRMQGEPGETGMEVGEIAGDIIAGQTKGGSDDRTYSMIPADHVVTHVRDEFIVDNQMGIGVSTTTYKWTLEYTWGPYTDSVFLLKRTKQIESRIEADWKIVDRRYYPRDKIWKNTTGPDATVNW